MAVNQQEPMVIPELGPFIVENAVQTGREIGAGAYGSVEEVEIPGACVAAKKLHHGLVHFGSEQQVQKWISDFVDECKLMSLLRHPHIVQFLGVCYLPGSRIPVLLMEKLQTSLDGFLETNKNIPLDVKISILIGTCRGVVYLHSRNPHIIHRDLTARNILIDSGLVAKIADLGVARMVMIQPGQLAATMTRTPGNIIYMPPEVMGEGSIRYSTAIDIFSFGNVALFTLTQIFPQNLKPASYRDPTTKRILGRSEIERREEYIQVMRASLSEAHPLVQLVLQCLEYDQEDRPSAVDMLSQLEGFEKTIPQNCGQTKIGLISRIADMQREKEEIQRHFERQLLAQNDQAQSEILATHEQDGMGCVQQDEKCEQIRELNEIISLQKKQLGTQQSMIDQLSCRIRQKVLHPLSPEDFSQTNQSMGGDEAMSKTSTLKSKKPFGLKKQTSTELQQHTQKPFLEKQKSTVSTELQQHTQTPTSSQLNWKKYKDVPQGMTLYDQPIILGRKMYARGVSEVTHTVLQYTIGRDRWKELPPPPVEYFSLATLRLGERLLLVGGEDSITRKKKDTILVWDARLKEWGQPFANMPSARSIPAVIEYQDHLIVAGGLTSEGSRVANVDILDTTSNKWYTAELLPSKDFYKPIVFENTVHLVGQSTRNVVAANLPKLISKAKTGLPHNRVWQFVTDAPFYYSSPISMGNSLLTVGGSVNSDYSSPVLKADIQRFDHNKKQWNKISEIPDAMYNCYCTVHSSDLYLLGGEQRLYDSIRSVYSAKLTVSST